MEVDASTRGTKRRREDEEFVHDTELWLSDGNVILVTAKETSDDKAYNAFRCHKSMLAKHSPVFHDMLSLPQSAEDEEYEGVPVVRLPDSTDDVRGLLKILYNSFEYV